MNLIKTFHMNVINVACNFTLYVFFRPHFDKIWAESRNPQNGILTIYFPTKKSPTQKVI